MKRGEVWTASGGPDYAREPRPVVIVQNDLFDATDSITICGFTSDDARASEFRLPVTPNDRNGLRQACSIMVDKISTVSKEKLGRRIGRLDDRDVVRLNRAIMVFLGLGGA